MEIITCKLCGSGASVPVLAGKDRDWGSGDRFTLVKCRECGLVYVNPRPDAEEIKKYYPDENWGRASGRTAEKDAEISGAHWTVAAAERAAAILGTGPGGSVLDVGCGDGFLLLYLSRLGWDCHGVEPGTVAAQYARTALNLDVRTGTLEEAEYPGSSFDVVSFHHVFEHLPDPAVTLAEAGRVLKSGGHLVVSVPNFGSLDRRLFGDKWVGLKLPQHLFHYTHRTLRAMLEKAGFVFCSVGYRSYEAKSTMYYSESFRHLLQDHGLYPEKKALAADEPAKALAPATPASWKEALHFLERGLFKSAGYIADALGLGSNMTMVVRKK